MMLVPCSLTTWPAHSFRETKFCGSEYDCRRKRNNLTSLQQCRGTGENRLPPVSSRTYTSRTRGYGRDQASEVRCRSTATVSELTPRRSTSGRASLGVRDGGRRSSPANTRVSPKNLPPSLRNNPVSRTRTRFKVQSMSRCLHPLSALQLSGWTLSVS